MESKSWQYDNLIKQWVAFNCAANQCFDKVKCLDFSAPLLLRLYLAPVFWMAGTQKLMHFSDTAEWFGNSEWGLGLPVPWLMAFLVTFFELTGSVFFASGFFGAFNELAAASNYTGGGVNRALAQRLAGDSGSDGYFCH